MLIKLHKKQKERKEQNISDQKNHIENLSAQIEKLKDEMSSIRNKKVNIFFFNKNYKKVYIKLAMHSHSLQKWYYNVYMHSKNAAQRANPRDFPKDFT